MVKITKGLPKSHRFSFKALYREDEGTALPFDFNDKSPVPRAEQDVLFNWIRFYLYKEVIGIESKHTARAKTYDLHKLLVFFEFSFGHQKIGLWDSLYRRFRICFREGIRDINCLPNFRDSHELRQVSNSP